MKVFHALLAGLLFTGLLASCNRDSGAPATTGKQDTSQQLYIEVGAIWSHDYFSDHILGLQTAGEIMGVRTEYVGPPTYDMEETIKAFEQAITRKPAGIMVVGFEPSLGAIVDKAVAKGIPVVTLDGDLPNCKRIAFVGTGNFQAGVLGGKKMAELVGATPEATGAKKKIAIMTKIGQPNLNERIDGYKKALAGYPDVQIVKIVDTQSDPQTAAQVAAAVLQEHPDLAGLACVEGAGGTGAATAVREAKKVGQVKIVSMDRGNEIMDQIRDNVIQATVVQQTALMPIYGLQILYNLHNKPVAVATDNAKAGITGAPTNIDTGVVIVDKSNYQYFYRARKK